MAHERFSGLMRDCNKAIKYPMFRFAHIADADGLSYFVLSPLYEWHIVGRTLTRMRTFRFSKWRQCAGALSKRVSLPGRWGHGLLVRMFGNVG